MPDLAKVTRSNMRPSDFVTDPAMAFLLALEYASQITERLEDATEKLDDVCAKFDRTDRHVEELQRQLGAASQRLQHVLINLMGGEGSDGTKIPSLVDDLKFRSLSIAKDFAHELSKAESAVRTRMHKASTDYQDDFNNVLNERRDECKQGAIDAAASASEIAQSLGTLQKELAILNKRLVATNSETPRVRGPISRFFAKIGL